MCQRPVMTYTDMGGWEGGEGWVVGWVSKTAAVNCHQISKAKGCTLYLEHIHKNMKVSYLVTHESVLIEPYLTWGGALRARVFGDKLSLLHGFT